MPNWMPKDRAVARVRSNGLRRLKHAVVIGQNASSSKPKDVGMKPINDGGWGAPLSLRRV